MSVLLFQRFKPIHRCVYYERDLSDQYSLTDDVS